MSTERQVVRYEITLTFRDPGHPPFVFRGVVPEAEAADIPVDLRFYTADAKLEACERAYARMKEAFVTAKPSIRFSSERVVKSTNTVEYDPAYPEARKRAEEMLAEEKHRKKMARLERELEDLEEIDEDYNPYSC